MGSEIPYGSWNFDFCLINTPNNAVTLQSSIVPTIAMMTKTGVQSRENKHKTENSNNQNHELVSIPFIF